MEFGPLHLWEQMSWIAKGVVVVLVLMSIWSLYVAIERWLFFKRATRQSERFAREATQLLAKGKPEEAIEFSRKFKQSHLARVTRAGLIEFVRDTATPHPATLDEVDAAKRAIERETLITYSDFKRGTGSLATIATTAPFVGLFGTVIGIINAFRGMAITGSGGIGAVSAGISEALVTTALGLFVAIPAAWIFNALTQRLERFQVEMSNASSELVDFLLRKQKPEKGAAPHAATGSGQ